MFEAFLLRVLLAGFGCALIAAPLGCFIVWRRMAYFGDVLAHSALLGVALSLLFEVHNSIGVFAVAALIALCLLTLRGRIYAVGHLSVDTLLGILSHASLAIGLLVVALLPQPQFDLMALLFGDILAVDWYDIAFIYGGLVLFLGVFSYLFKPLLLLTVSEELAQSEGLAVLPLQIVFMLMTALVIAAAIKLIGVLLISSLMIIPAAVARRFARSPEGMVMLAALFGCVSVVLGLAVSLWLNIATALAIVSVAVVFFILSRLPWPKL